jgi:hypothetical protein
LLIVAFSNRYLELLRDTVKVHVVVRNRTPTTTTTVIIIIIIIIVVV